MQRFQFRLETLLKYRAMLQEQAQVKFAEALQKLQAEQEKLAGLNNKLSDSLQVFCEKQTRHELVKAQEFQMFSNFFAQMKTMIALQQEKVNTAEAYRYECLLALEDAVKNCKLVERLKEKRLLEYRALLLQEEQKQLDEMASQRYVKEG
ncbi:MAG: flagellar export protein FliJ [Pelosinus sp.]|nr:flagellar export protein FliJ [Pelosinus sp.]